MYLLSPFASNPLLRFMTSSSSVLIPSKGPFLSSWIQLIQPFEIF